MLAAAPQQLSIVQRVIALLTASLRELLREPFLVLQMSMRCLQGPAFVAALSASMSAVDGRAEQIATTARTLLEALHNHPWRVTSLETLTASTSDSKSSAECGADNEEITKMSTCSWPAAAANGSSEDSCPICLNKFRDGDLLRVLPCGHNHHQGCIDEWLRIRNCCSLCKTPAVKRAETYNQSPTSATPSSYG
ncbi:hypothetical protein CYMTET_35039 [Cymbomonas tetramitiformis]|uniref:RING-type domain-containing protein n=1 Tax=Cymbomonas tetramitiformis TaxID=36881 RepID=A0AAE0KPK3_9CHLO|nr:hypothetical protein CYMTET_35039 [Cymbomonas tetramitiformis]